MSPGTAAEIGCFGHHRTILIQPPGYKGLAFPRGWLVTSFKLEHDASEPIGFYINQEGEHLLFIPDTAYVENRFEGITIISVECNNIAELLSKNILEGNIPAIVGKRIRRNHMSLENLIAMLKANDLSKCRQIFLMHLSQGNSSEEEMRRQIQEATGIPTYVCGEQ